MLPKLEEFRAAIAALAAGMIATALGQFVPAVRDALGPEAVNVLSVAIAATAALVTEDRVDGWSAREAARWLRDELIRTPDDEHDAADPEGRS